MSGPVPYLSFPGSAREALAFYQSVFGGELVLVTCADANRTDAPPEAIAHGQLTGPVALFGSDAGEGEPTVSTQGLLLTLLGTASPDLLRTWFGRLAEAGEVLDPLVERPWGDYDGQVRDRYGLTWLIGFHPE